MCNFSFWIATKWVFECCEISIWKIQVSDIALSLDFVCERSARVRPLPPHVGRDPATSCRSERVRLRERLRRERVRELVPEESGASSGGVLVRQGGLRARAQREVLGCCSQNMVKKIANKKTIKVLLGFFKSVVKNMGEEFPVVTKQTQQLLQKFGHPM